MVTCTLEDGKTNCSTAKAYTFSRQAKSTTACSRIPSNTAAVPTTTKTRQPFTPECGRTTWNRAQACLIHQKSITKGNGRTDWSMAAGTTRTSSTKLCMLASLLRVSNKAKAEWCILMAVYMLGSLSMSYPMGLEIFSIPTKIST